MKTKVFLMLVFGLASLANAVPMQLRVAYGGLLSSPTGPPTQAEYFDPVDSELLLAPSHLLWVGIYNPVDGVPDAQQKPLVMLGIVSPPFINWTGNWVQYKPPLVAGAPANEYFGDAIDIYGDQSLIVDLWVIDLSDGSPDTVNLTGILDAKQLHAAEPSLDNVVLLFNDAAEIIDTIIIHNAIPEPATITLLGFGAIALRKRRT